MKPTRKGPLTLDEAETIGLAALVFLTEEPRRLTRFLATSGLGPDDLAGRAGEPEVLAAVLGALAEDESLLLVFAAERTIAPATVMAARNLLGGPSAWDSL